MNAGIYALGERRPQTAGEDFYVAPGAQLIGSVILRAGASVWFNCVLRADDELIEVGAGSNVQDGSVIHSDAGAPSVIGRAVTIGHMVLLHSCLIGDETLVGNGAIVMDRARIGKHCIIAAGALVPPDRQIADGSVLMGAPAKLVRSVTAADLSMIAQGAAHYQARMQSYRRELRAVAADLAASGANA
jgi:carbonic anhydrase/acetyltransferase-like protein (isoleucine patch superfamily)